MHYIITCTDRPDSGAVRAATRPRHIDYLTGLGKTIVMGGPRLAADAVTPIGSTLVVEAASLEAAEALAAADPYAQAGLFAEVVVAPFRLVFLNPPEA